MKKKSIRHPNDFKSIIFRMVRQCCLFAAVCLLLSGHAYAQSVGNINTKTVALGFTKEKLYNALLTLEKSSGFRLVFPSEPVDAARLIDLPKEERTVAATLRLILNGTGLDFKQAENTVVLFLKNENTPVNIPKTLTVRGTVSDDGGNPLPGAVVTVKGNTRKSAAANADGTFILNDVPTDAVLLVYILGFETVEEALNGRTSINVALAPQVQALENVVVTGYTTLTKERATGAFGRVTSEILEKSHSSNLSTALLGTVAGMKGKENADGTVDYTVRGTASLYANAQPLVVVDGFPVVNGFKDINPNDVESVTVLKDAAASSIWGARSANGVIVVVTRKADKKKLDINVSATVRIGEKIDLSTALKTASSKDQVAWEKMAYDNKWFVSGGQYTNSFSMLASPMSLVKELLYQHKDGLISDGQLNAGLEKLSNTNNRKQIKDLLLQNPVLQQYNVSVSGGNDRMQNFFSVQYEHGVGNVINKSQDRWRMGYNNQINVFKWLDFNFATNLHYVKANNSGPTMSEIEFLSPYEMILNEDGSYATELNGVNRLQWEKIPKGTLPYDDWDYNILRETRARELTTTDLNTRFQAGLTFKLLKGLTFDTKFQYEYNIGKFRNYYSEDSYYVRDWANFVVDYDQTAQKVVRQFIPKGGILQTGDRTDFNYSWRNQLNYNRTFAGKHAVSVLAGTETSQYRTDATNNPWVWGYNPATNGSSYLPYGGHSYNGGVQIKNIMGKNVAQLDYPSGGSPGAFWYIDSAVTGTKSRQRQDRNTESASFDYRNDRYLSYYANGSYTFDGKYSLSGSVRSDASNLITNDPKYRWAPMWSIGGLWNAHSESFMTGSDWLNRLSLRLTYGFNGNVDKTTSPLTLISMGTSPNATTGTVTGRVSSYGNPYLRWERTSTVNFGVDFALFGNSLFGSIDVYSKKGKDIIGNIALAAMTGTGTQKLNQAGVSNKGIEVELGANTALWNSGVSLSTKVTYAYNKNRVTKLYNPDISANDYLNGAEYGLSFYEGYPTASVWSFEYLGMKDGVPYITGAKGQPAPMNTTATLTGRVSDGYLIYNGPAVGPHTLGWYGTFSGYGVSLSFLLTGSFGGYFRNPTFSYPLLSLGKDIIPMFVEDVMNGSTDIPSWPAPNATDFTAWSYYMRNLNTLVENGSFIKLKEVTLDYKLPQKWTKPLGIARVNVYAQVRDLGCLWVSNSRGYDPEWLPGTLPPATTYAFGLNINF